VRVLTVPQPAAAAIADRDTGQSCRLLWCSWPDAGCAVVPGTRCACLATVHSWWVCSHRMYVRVGCWRCSARGSPVCPCDGTGTYRSGRAWPCAVCYLCMGDRYPPRPCAACMDVPGYAARRRGDKPSNLVRIRSGFGTARVGVERVRTRMIGRLRCVFQDQCCRKGACGGCAKGNTLPMHIRSEQLLLRHTCSQLYQRPTAL
jgi:hypothetical protein